LQILPEGNEGDIGTKTANLLHAVANAAALVDSAEDHAVAGGDRRTPGVIPAQDVDEIGILRKRFGKAVAIGSIPRCLELIDQLVQRSLVVRHTHGSRSLAG